VGGSPRSATSPGLGSARIKIPGVRGCGPERLGIDLGMKTDPALLASILREDMFLDDFAPPGPARREPRRALAPAPMLERARAAIVSSNRPYMISSARCLNGI